MIGIAMTALNSLMDNVTNKPKRLYDYEHKTLRLIAYQTPYYAGMLRFQTLKPN